VRFGAKLQGLALPAARSGSWVPERIRQYRSGYYRTAKSLSNPFFKVLESPENLLKKVLWWSLRQSLKVFPFGSAVRVVVPERIRQYLPVSYRTAKPFYNPLLKVLKSPEKLF